MSGPATFHADFMVGQSGALGVVVVRCQASFAFHCCIVLALPFATFGLTALAFTFAFVVAILRDIDASTLAAIGSSLEPG